MAASPDNRPRYTHCLEWPGGFGLFGLITLSLFLVACSTSPVSSISVNQLPSLHTGHGEVTVEQTAQLAPTPDLLAVDEDMRAFVEYYTGGVANDRQRLKMLHRALVGSGAHDLQYDPFADGSAREAFHQGSANCLSYASLFIALAREADLDAGYQWLDVRPQWSQMGARVAVRLHVNTRIDLRHEERFMVDLDPLPTREIAGSRSLTDRDGQALYHNNLAMDALARDDLPRAWAHSVQALRLSPDMAHLWVNLGAVYRVTGQHREAERYYLHALELSPADRSAMNNLAILYGLEGREADRQYWMGRVERYRESNPYYHAWLGDQAGRLGNWQEALHHYEKAVGLLPEDSHLLYARGLIHYELNELDEASRDIGEAMEKATLRTDRETYRNRLEAVKRESLAGI